MHPRLGQARCHAACVQPWRHVPSMLALALWLPICHAPIDPHIHTHSLTHTSLSSPSRPPGPPPPPPPQLAARRQPLPLHGLPPGPRLHHRGVIPGDPVPRGRGRDGDQPVRPCRCLGAPGLLSPVRPRPVCHLTPLATLLVQALRPPVSPPVQRAAFTQPLLLRRAAQAAGGHAAAGVHPGAGRGAGGGAAG